MSIRKRMRYWPQWKGSVGTKLGTTRPRRRDAYLKETIKYLIPNSLMERETGIEPATSSLGSWRSTAELLPLAENKPSLALDHG